MRVKRANRRGKPPGRLTQAIFVILLAGPRTSRDIAKVLGRPPRYIASYLHYWEAKGYLECYDGYWRLTEKGRSYAARIVEEAARRAVDGRVSRLAEALAQAIQSINGG